MLVFYYTPMCLMHGIFHSNKYSLSDEKVLMKMVLPMRNIVDFTRRKNSPKDIIKKQTFPKRVKDDRHHFSSVNNHTHEFKFHIWIPIRKRRKFKSSGEMVEKRIHKVKLYIFISQQYMRIIWGLAYLNNKVYCHAMPCHVGHICSEHTWQY